MSTHTLVQRPEVLLPSVNLLPPEIAEAARQKRVQVAMGVAVVAAIGVVGGLYLQAHQAVNAANSQLAAAQQQQTRLQAEVASYREVTQIDAQVSAREALLTEAMGQEIQWSTYLNDLSLKIPANVWLTNFSATEGSGSAAASSTPSPIAGAAATVGSISFNGTAMSHDDVATWLESLATEHGFTDPYFTNSTESKIGTRQVVNFSSTVQLTSDALSGRYTQQAGN